MVKVNTQNIRLDGGTQYREVIDQQTVYTYVERIKEGDEFPPIETVYDGSTYWLVDGFHRFHAYMLIGIKEIEVSFKHGTQVDAQLAALRANCTHGKPLTSQDKRNKVKMALSLQIHENISNYEIAKICGVSGSFVAAVRSPEAKQRQDEAKTKHLKRKAQALQCSSQTIIKKAIAVNSAHPDEVGPDEDEMKAAELAEEKDREVFYKLLESDDALATAYEEIKRLNHLNAQLSVRINGLMNERNEAIKMLKKFQRRENLSHR